MATSVLQRGEGAIRKRTRHVVKKPWLKTGRSDRSGERRGAETGLHG